MISICRRCDRFWYENGNQAGRFTEAQLAEIRKVALARLLCENSDTITEVTRSVFDLPHNFLNPRVPCRSLPPLDLTPWREQESANCVVLGKTIALGASSLVSPCTSCTCTAEGVSFTATTTRSFKLHHSNSLYFYWINSHSVRACESTASSCSLMWVAMPFWPTVSVAFNALSSSIPHRPHQHLLSRHQHRNGLLNNRVDRRLVNHSEALVYYPICWISLVKKSCHSFYTLLLLSQISLLFHPSILDSHIYNNLEYRIVCFFRRMVLFCTQRDIVMANFAWPETFQMCRGIVSIPQMLL